MKVVDDRACDQLSEGTEVAVVRPIQRSEVTDPIALEDDCRRIAEPDEQQVEQETSRPTVAIDEGVNALEDAVQMKGAEPVKFPARGAAVIVDLFVPNEGADTVSVIDLATDTVTRTVPVGSAPITVAFTPDGDRALVVDRGSMSVSVIDTDTGVLLHTVVLGRDPGSISVGSDGRTAYVTGGDVDVLFTVTL